VAALPDLGNLSDGELRALIRDLQAREHRESYDRKILHAKVDILRCLRVARAAI
jgi:hypothetical protein